MTKENLINEILVLINAYHDLGGNIHGIATTKENYAKYSFEELIGAASNWNKNFEERKVYLRSRR